MIQSPTVTTIQSIHWNGSRYCLQQALYLKIQSACFTHAFIQIGKHKLDWQYHSLTVSTNNLLLTISFHSNFFIQFRLSSHAACFLYLSSTRWAVCNPHHEKDGRGNMGLHMGNPSIFSIPLSFILWNCLTFDPLHDLLPYISTGYSKDFPICFIFKTGEE